jgi:outer membrane protein TolC
MNRAAVSILVVGLLMAVARPVSAQPAARRISFADVAAAVVQNNLELRAAGLDVAIAQAQLAQAEAGHLPQVNLSGSYARNQQQPGQTVSFPNPFNPTPPVIHITLPSVDPNVYAAGLIISYPLYTGGRVEAQIALAEANLRGAQATFDRTKQQAVYASEQIYLQGLLAYENVAAARRALDQANESLRVSGARFDTGVAAQFDVLQAQVAVANAEQSLVKAQTSVASAQASLNASVGMPQDTPLELTDTLTPRPVEGSLADAIARALRERPDLMALRSQMAATQASIDVAQSGVRPTVSLGAGYALTNANGQSTSVFGAWSVTLGVTLSVFDGGSVQARVREARLRLDQLKLRETQMRQQVELDVRQAWLALQQSAGELTAATRAVEQGREAARLAAVRYQAGVGTSLEILSAQATLAQAELSLASARFGQNTARIQLILAMGSI